jgi:GNAT superfamily N-acetyltransferase
MDFSILRTRPECAEDEKGGMVTVSMARNGSAAVRFLQIFSHLCGIFFADIFLRKMASRWIDQLHESAGRPGEWVIANVTVLPSHRRHGIARKLVASTMAALKERKAKLVSLEVIEDNLPAFNLYKELGFIPYASETQYNAPEMNISLPSLPEGWSVTPLQNSNWRIRYELELRTTPEKVKQFEPVSERKFRTPFIRRILGKLIEWMSGTKNTRLVLYTPDGEAAGIAFHNVRVRSGGVNYAGFVLDPKYAEIAQEFFQLLQGPTDQPPPN